MKRVSLASMLAATAAMAISAPTSAEVRIRNNATALALSYSPEPVIGPERNWRAGKTGSRHHPMSQPKRRKLARRLGCRVRDL